MLLDSFGIQNRSGYVNPASLLSIFTQCETISVIGISFPYFPVKRNSCAGGKPFRFPAGTLIIDRVPDGDGRRPHPGGLERLFPCAESLQR